MVKYLIHCTYRNYFKSIIQEKVIKTRNDLNIYERGMGDIVYFSFHNPKNWNNLIKEYDMNELSEHLIPRSICILLKIVDVVKKYKYFFISPYWDYGESAHKISSRLHKLVQKSKNINDLEKNILMDKQMSEQCRESLLVEDRLKLLFNFKNSENISIKKFIDENGYYDRFEICFFDNVDFSDLEFKIIDKFDYPEYKELYQSIKK